MIGDEASAVACINEVTDINGRAYSMALTINASASPKLVPGIYLVFLDGLDATKNVVLATAATSSSPSVSTPDSSGQNAAIFPGSSVERIRVLANRTFVVAKLSTGTGTLYLVPLTIG